MKIVINRANLSLLEEMLINYYNILISWNLSSSKYPLFSLCGPFTGQKFYQKTYTLRKGPGHLIQVQ